MATTASDHQCTFWKLPVEIRWTIYDLVYGGGRTIQPQQQSTFFKLRFSGRCKHEAIEVEQLPDRPATVVDRRLVNKQFLSETLQHLAEKNTFIVYRRAEGILGLPRSFLIHVRSLIVTWEAYTYPDPVNIRKVCRRLRSLKIKLDWNQMTELCKEKELTGAAVKSMNFVKAMSGVHGLEHFAIEDDAPIDVELSLKSPQYYDALLEVGGRLKKVERYVRKMVTGLEALNVKDIPSVIALQKKARNRRG